ncbi:unnamed protein product [Colias eurytheme]|nr:unnamed protein product [Colias eurytheme]
MPVNHSPPVSPTPQSAITTSATTVTQATFSSHESSLTHCASAPDLSLIPITAERKKRKIEGDDTTVSSELTRDIFVSFSNKQESQFEDLMFKINNIIEQNIELKKSVEMMSNQYDEFLSRISSLESERVRDKKLIQQLEEKIDSLERSAKSTEIEIRNIPRADRETKEDLCNMVTYLGQAINVDINQTNLKDIHRVRTKDKSSTVVVNFQSAVMKDKVIKGVKSFNKGKDKSEKLNTTHFHLVKHKQPVYVSERLTYKTQRLYYLARTQYKNYGYNFCWTSHGVVYVRKHADDPHIRITTEEDLQKLKSNSSM